MNPQMTVTRTTGGNTYRVVASAQGLVQGKPAAYGQTVRAADVSNPTRTTTPNAAERERQETLEFLHKLVMG